MKEHLLASLLLSTMLATNLSAAAEATSAVNDTFTTEASNNIPEHIAAKETTSEVKVETSQQATWATPQNILIGTGVVAAFLFPEAAFTLAAGYFAYHYFFSSPNAKAAEIKPTIKIVPDTKKNEQMNLVPVSHSLPETIALNISGNTFFVNPRIIAAYMQKYDVSFDEVQSALAKFLNASKKTKKSKTIAVKKEPAAAKVAVVVPRLNFASLTSPLDAENSHRHMEKAQTARSPHPFVDHTHIERRALDDLGLVAVNLMPHAEMVMADTLPATDLSFFASSKTEAHTARSESPESTTSTTAAVVTPAKKKSFSKSKCHPA